MHAAVLRYFEAVAEDGSIRRASERLHISPSAVNRQILKIEDYFGTPLFERRPDGMRLTDAGRLVLRHARATLHDFTRLRGEIDQLRGIVSGNVTITTLDSLDEAIGVGSALVEAVEEWAREAGMKRLWLVTTNDNLEALKFWQKRGYELVSVHRNAIADARRIKPQIPITGLHGITIRDEIELEKII